MASLSSTGSVSGSSSLGNTSLRGFGGMVSGINRDEIIEAMTLHTTNKIANQKADITKLQWKQEAYRNLTDQILDLSDKYTSYSSSSSLIDPITFAKSLITVNGLDEATRYVKASGTSSLVDNVSLTAVKQLATAAVRQSAAYTGGSLQTSLEDLDADWTSSNLEGRKLVFGTYEGDKFKTVSTFEFKSTYTDTDGTVKNIDYTGSNKAELVRQLNLSMDEQDIDMQFTLKDGKIGLQAKTSGSDTENLVIAANSTALNGLGYVKGSGGADYTGDNKDYDKKGISLDAFNANVTGEFADASVSPATGFSYMKGQKLTFTYDGTAKSIDLITDADAKELAELEKTNGPMSKEEKMTWFANKLQGRLDQAFGKDAVKIGGDRDADGKITALNGALSFSTKDDSTVSITSNNSALLKNLGIVYGESNKVNLNGKLNQSALGIDLSSDPEYTKNGEAYLKINGVEIKGINADSSIKDIITKINNSKAGVKATYLDATGQFMLVTNETGEGREINLDSKLAQDLFGQKNAAGDYEADLGVTNGKNALVSVSYGNGVTVDLERSSNTFNLEGMSVTVSGVFGGNWKTDADGNKVQGADGKDIWEYDSAETVTFSARADVDKVTEKVKGFFEDFNKLVKDINSQVTTRPDSSYKPLTDEQKAEMDETSIENWEKKAKEGLLYNDATIRGLSMDVQAVFTNMLSNGASFEDLEKIGITYSEDEKDGGVLIFNEDKFREAMESDPELVSDIFTGGGNVKKGLMTIVDETFTPYATRYASKNAGGNSSGSYGQLIEIAGTEKKPTTMINNQIYNQLKQMNDALAVLQDRLKVEQDRYISQFSYMESMINQFNSQASYLSQITG